MFRLANTRIDAFISWFPRRLRCSRQGLTAVLARKLLHTTSSEPQDSGLSGSDIGPVPSLYLLTVSFSVYQDGQDALESP